MFESKHASVHALLRQLPVAENNWKIVDFWDADTLAIGISTSGVDDRLVYISISSTQSDLYYFECEVANDYTNDEYSVMSSGENITYEELMEVLTTHLGGTGHS